MLHLLVICGERLIHFRQEEKSVLNIEVKVVCPFLLDFILPSKELSIESGCLFTVGVTR